MKVEGPSDFNEEQTPQLSPKTFIQSAKKRFQSAWKKFFPSKVEPQENVFVGPQKDMPSFQNLGGWKVKLEGIKENDVQSQGKPQENLGSARNLMEDIKSLNLPKGTQQPSTPPRRSSLPKEQGLDNVEKNDAQSQREHQECIDSVRNSASPPDWRHTFITYSIDASLLTTEKFPLIDKSRGPNSFQISSLPIEQKSAPNIDTTQASRFKENEFQTPASCADVQAWLSRRGKNQSPQSTGKNKTSKRMH